jgi:hypothetical protein
MNSHYFCRRIERFSEAGKAFRVFSARVALVRISVEGEVSIHLLCLRVSCHETLLWTSSSH